MNEVGERAAMIQYLYRICLAPKDVHCDIHVLVTLRNDDPSYAYSAPALIIGNKCAI
jgi:hypothetical protein